MLSKVWEITYPFPNLNGCAIEVWEWIKDFIPQLIQLIVHILWNQISLYTMQFYNSLCQTTLYFVFSYVCLLLWAHISCWEVVQNMKID